MSHPLLDIDSIEQTPDIYINSISRIFAIFDEQTQDSGNISYSVEIDGKHYFIKTAGTPNDPKPYLDHPQRVALLQNAVRLRYSCDHPALPQLYNIIESPHGPLLVYEWLDGERIGVFSEMRDDPQSSFQRFRRLPSDEILLTLDVIYDLHQQLMQSGWIAVDFYDGCLIYDFERRMLRVMDLDTYREAPFTNKMGRMFGSKRFMAPEEFERGAQIDQRTTLFTMGRTAAVLLSDGTLDRSPFRGSDSLYQVIRRACQANRSDRFDSMDAFYRAWCEARRTG